LLPLSAVLVSGKPPLGILISFNGIKHAVALVQEVHRGLGEVSYDVTIKIEHLLKRLSTCPCCGIRVPRLQSVFPGVKIKLRGDAGFALPLLYAFCEFFDIEHALGIPANAVFKSRTQPRRQQLEWRYHRIQLPQRSFSSLRHRAGSWPCQRRICYKAEHTAAGTNLRFLITNRTGHASQVFAFYNNRGECENRIKEFKNGFHADRLSCHRFRPTPFDYCCTPPPTT
jgi:hypothetical protein